MDIPADPFSAPHSTPAARHTPHHVVTGGETIAPRGRPKLFSPGSIERGQRWRQSGKPHGTSFHSFSSPEMGPPVSGTFAAGNGMGPFGAPGSGVPADSQQLESLPADGGQSLEAASGVFQHPETVADNPTTVPRGKSIIHHELQAGNMVFFSVDLEHGGQWAGILQLSAQAFLLDGTILGEFNKYVKPPENAHVPASLTSTHGLTQHSDQIKNANPIEFVWPQFVGFVEQYLEGGVKKGVMVAWNGASCDVEWFFHVTRDSDWNHSNTLVMPKGLDYFMDPMRVISHYKSCQLHNSKTDLDGYGLEQTYCFVKKVTQLVGAHNSLVDAQAQTVICLDRCFLPFIDRSGAVCQIDILFQHKFCREEKAKAEKDRPVPAGWVDDTDGDTAWDLPEKYRYKGHVGGGECGPSSAVQTAISQGDSDINKFTSHPMLRLFFFIWPLKLFHEMATMSNKYAHEDWVRPVKSTDRAGVERKRSILVPCDEDHPDARHRVKDGNGGRWCNFTAGSIIAWFSILLLQGAYGLHHVGLFWEEEPYGCNHAFIQNLMPWDNFYLIRQFLHFVDNVELPGKHDPGWHPLQKIQPVLDSVQKQMQKAWTLGKKICVDESMIKYMGRAIAWVQFNPRKPIKHGIKVFALCCGKTGVLVSFLIYTGKDIDVHQDWTPVGVVDKLLEMAGLLSEGAGRILFTDNWYTSLALMNHLYFKWGFLLIGTYVLSKKLARTASDFPFHQLSNGALKYVQRG